MFTMQEPVKRQYSFNLLLIFFLNTKEMIEFYWFM